MTYMTRPETEALEELIAHREGSVFIQNVLLFMASFIAVTAGAYSITGDLRRALALVSLAFVTLLINTVWQTVRQRQEVGKARKLWELRDQPLTPRRLPARYKDWGNDDD